MKGGLIIRNPVEYVFDDAVFFRPQIIQIGLRCRREFLLLQPNQVPVRNDRQSAQGNDLQIAALEFVFQSDDGHDESHDDDEPNDGVNG